MDELLATCICFCTILIGAALPDLNTDYAHETPTAYEPENGPGTHDAGTHAIVDAGGLPSDGYMVRVMPS